MSQSCTIITIKHFQNGVLKSYICCIASVPLWWVTTMTYFFFILQRVWSKYEIHENRIYVHFVLFNVHVKVSWWSKTAQCFPDKSTIFVVCRGQHDHIADGNHFIISISMEFDKLCIQESRTWTFLSRSGVGVWTDVSVSYTIFRTPRVAYNFICILRSFSSSWSWNLLPVQQGCRFFILSLFRYVPC